MDLHDLTSFGALFLLGLTLVCFLLPVLVIFPPIPVEKSDALRVTHSKIGLEKGEANVLKTQFDREEHDAKDGKKATIRGLFVYPVKSCRGIEVRKSKVLRTGLEFDRLYTFAELKTVPARPGGVDGGGGKGADVAKEPQQRWEFVTQRQYPLLATVDVDVWVPDQTKKSRLLESSGEAFIVVRFPRRTSGVGGLLDRLAAKIGKGLRGVPETEVLLPVEFPSEAEIAERGYGFDEVTVWKETVRALNMEKDLPSELGEYLGVGKKTGGAGGGRLGIFRIRPEDRREVYRAAPRRDEIGYQPAIDFHDAYPLHLMNLSSLNDLEGKVEKDENLKELDVRRFRSNIIVSGAPAYDEDTWRSIQFEKLESKINRVATFDVSCRTVRCKMPNVDPDTGLRHDVEPDRALRRHRDVDEGAPRKGCMGMQLCPLFDTAAAPGVRMDDLESWIEVGMTMEVLKRGSHFYIKQ